MTGHRLSGGARLLTKKEITFIQRVTGKFLYYARAADCTMLHALNDIATKTINGTTETMDAINTFMDYAAWHPDASVLFCASDMILHIESDGAHLTAPKERSRAGGYHYLGNKHDDMFNAPFHVLTKVMKHVTASAEETELGAICANAREGTIFRQALHGMGHTQKSTPITTNATTARAILDNNAPGRYLKGAGMRLHWMKDRAKRDIFTIK